MKLLFPTAVAVVSTLGPTVLDAAPGAVVVFNELHYHPSEASGDSEWLELFNQQGIKVDISGWRIDGLDYSVPAGTLIEPGGYVVVSRSPGEGQLGPFPGRLNNGGERLRLYNQGGRLMDEVDYSDDAPWPAGADGSGATLAKVAPYSDSAEPQNWAASARVGGTPGTSNFPVIGEPPATSTLDLIALADAWRYNESGADLGPDWAKSAHPVSGSWASGPGGIGSENGTTIPLATQLTPPFLNNPRVVTYYFEREFDLSEAQFAGLQSFNLRHGFDDGGIVYINGTEVLRVNMPLGNISAETLASEGNEVTDLSASISVPTGSLVVGENRISVEVHQEGSGSSDIVFGLEAVAEVADGIPGLVPKIVFNEIPAAGVPDFWVELVNRGTGHVELGGISIAAAAGPEREYTLPGGTLAPGTPYFIDGDTLGFRPNEGEKLFLYGAGGKEVLDARKVTGRLRGRYGKNWLYPSSPTPGATNTFQINPDVVISEIAYNPPSLPAAEADFEVVSLVGMGGNWRYNDSDALPPDWATAAHPVGGTWVEGAGPVGRESGSLPVPLGTDLFPTYRDSTVTYYFEKEFAVSPQDIGGFTSLEVTHQIDDGAIFYINGVEAGRFNMPGGDVGPETLASTGIGDAELVKTSLAASSLVAGQNRLSVEVHQGGIPSSDIVFGAALDAVTERAPAQPARNSDNQWIEIANRGTAQVDLSGWALDDGVEFQFPAGTVLGPGEYACVVKDRELFSSAYNGPRVIGEFSGSLSRSGEVLHLRDGNRNTVDTVRYYDGGNWPGDADGGGATLELRDLDADNAVGAAWAPSDESGRTAWRTYSYTEDASSRRGPDNQWQEFNMGLMGAGEVLIDDITVSTGKIADPGFDDPSSWRFRGNHRHSAIIEDPDQPGNKVLRLRATGPTEHMHNQIETTLTGAISSGVTYTIAFRARWVRGSNRLHTRLYFNRCANVNVLDRPGDPGTPGAPNTAEEPNLGPTFTSLKHDPPVPAAGEPTVVSIAASDPDGVTTMALHYSVDGGAFQSIPMGAAGSRYQAGVPGQGEGSIVQFYVSAVDSRGAAAFFPPEGPESRALYEVDGGDSADNGWHNFRIVMTQADTLFQHGRTEVMSNDRLGCTVIDREEEIYYNCAVRLKSSERGRPETSRVGYNLRFPADGLFRGCHETVALDRSEGVSTGQRELLFDMMISNSGGEISRYYDFVKLLAPNGALTGGAVLQFGRYDEIFLDSQFENGGDGRLYEYELVYYPTSADRSGMKLPQPDQVLGVSVTDLGADPEYYRWFFLNKINRELDDFGPIIEYCKKMGQRGNEFSEGLGEVVDIDGWLRGMAYAVLSGAGDNASAGDQHNGYYYAKPDGRVMFLPHDMDFSFSATRSITQNAECAKLVSDPARLRVFLGHLHDIITTTYNAAYMSIWSDHFNEFDPTQPWNRHLSFCVARSNNVLDQINSRIGTVVFDVTTPSPVTASGSTATVSGEGWVDVREIRMQGNSEPLVVTWLDGDSWEATLPAPLGESIAILEAVNFSGEVVGTETVTINNTTSLEPASASNLVVSEIMYNPGDGAGSEFVEVMNIGAGRADLTGVRFTDGIDFEFPMIALEPGERLVVLESQFLNATGLSKDGENLTLVDAGGTTVRDFAYDDRVPWPEAADGDGYSLVLADPYSNPDHGLARNWRTSARPGGSPGVSDSTVFSGDPDADGDRDGLSDFLEYALGSSSLVPGAEGTSVARISPTLVFSYTRNLAADAIAYTVEVSEDLVQWEPASGFIETSVPLGDGRTEVTFRIDSTERFLAVRLRVESK